MNLPKFKYLEPNSLAEACSLLTEQGSAPVAGGTDLIPALKNRVKQPRVLVDVMRIAGLDTISYEERGGLSLGSAVSLRRLAAHPIIKEKYPLLAQAATMVAGPQIRAMGTVVGNLCQDTLCDYYSRSGSNNHGLELCFKAGGNVCHTVKGSEHCWATYCGDLAPALLVLQAKLKVFDREGERIIPLQELYAGKGRRPMALKPGHLVAEVLVPPPAPGSSGVYLKLRTRQSIDYPLLGVALNLELGENNQVQAAAVGLTGIDKKPVLLDGSGVLAGKPDPAKIELLAEEAFRLARPLNNLRDLTPNYRKEMVRVYVKAAVEQALHKAAERAGE